MTNRKQYRSEDVVRSGRPDDCPSCPTYRTCHETCEAVERWISQDHVPRSNNDVMENNVQSMDDFSNEFVDRMTSEYPVKVVPDRDYARKAWQRIKGLNVPRKQLEFARLFYKDAKTLTQTAVALGISAQAADERHKRLKKELKDRLEREEMWKKMRPYFESRDLNLDHVIVCFYYQYLISRREIAKMCGVPYSTVETLIKRVVKALDNRGIVDDVFYSQDQRS